MINIAVIDLTANSRSALVERLTGFQREAINAQPFCPQIGLNSYSLEEAKFHEAADVVLLGRQLLKTDLAEIATVRRIFPSAVLMADLPPELDNFIILEQMSRLGISDILSHETSGNEFFRRLLVNSRPHKAVTRGKLIVIDSGKGGLGTTTIAASLAEALGKKSLKTAVIDLDGESQDLSRFSGTRPAHNENLDLLLHGQRPITAEAVAECMYAMSGADDGVMLSPSTTICWHSLDHKSAIVRSAMSFFEILDELFDSVIVDLASIRGSFRKFLMKAADVVIVVGGQDPAGLFATAHLLKGLSQDLHVTADTRVTVLMNRFEKSGLPVRYLEQQLFSGMESMTMATVPLCHAAGRWPGSGHLPLTLGSRAFRRSIEAISMTLLSDAFQQAPVEQKIQVARPHPTISGPVPSPRGLPEPASLDPFEAGLIGKPVIQNA